MSRPSSRPPGLRIAKPSGFKERLAATFLLGLLLFNPPLLAVASNEGWVAGLPVLFAWLFGSWAAIIAILAYMIEARHGHGD